MADETISNLEPINEEDLNLKDKFVGGGEAKKTVESQKENITPFEAKPEKKEGSAEKEAAYSKILSKAPPQTKATQPEEDVVADASAVNTGIDAESKIDNLVKLAETKGITHAVKVAQHMEDNYTLDEFHDRLLGEELHKALLAKGIIKEI
jgi:hypothetical protein